MALVEQFDLASTLVTCDDGTIRQEEADSNHHERTHRSLNVHGDTRKDSVIPHKQRYSLHSFNDANSIERIDWMTVKHSSWIIGQEAMIISASSRSRASSSSVEYMPFTMFRLISLRKYPYT